MSVLSRTSRNRLVTTLESIRALHSPDGREALLNDLPSSLIKSIPRSTVLHRDLTNIVLACDDAPGLPTSRTHPLYILLENARDLAPHSEAAAFLERLLALFAELARPPADTPVSRPPKPPHFATQEAALAEGEYHLFNGDYDGAIRICTEITQRNPHSAVAYCYLGMAYQSKKNYKQALINYTRSIEIQPTFDACHNRGKVYEYTYHDYEHAIADYSQAIRIHPNIVVTYYDRGTAYLSIGRHKAAIDDLTEAILRTTRYAAAYHARAKCYQARGDWRNARADYQKVLRFSNDRTLRGSAQRALQEICRNLPWWQPIIDRLLGY